MNINEVNHLLVKAVLAQSLWRKRDEWDDAPDQVVVWYKGIVRVSSMVMAHVNTILATVSVLTVTSMINFISCECYVFSV